MRPFLIVLVALSIPSAAVADTTARFKAAKGQILVSDGNGFRASGRTTALKTGDRVVVSPGGNATIVYNNGCAVTLSSGTVYTIDEEAPCAAQHQGQAQAEAAGEAALDSGAGVASAALAAGTFDVTAAAVLGGAAAIASTAFLASTLGKSASP